VNTPTGESLQAIGPGELVRIFPGLSLMAAHRLIRSKDFPNFKIGRNRYTTEAWLAGWMTKQLRNPPPLKCFDPLEAAVVDRAAWAVGELVRTGRLSVAGCGLAEELPTLKS
jgi:hypothetical protein